MWAFLFIKFEPSCAGMKTISFLFFISLLSFDSFSQCDKYVKVVDRLTLKPLAYADVSIYDVDALSYPVYIPAITSDSSGIVKLSICPNRSYKVNANKDGYFPAVESVTNFFGDTLIVKMDGIGKDKYVKVVESRSGEPLDSFGISFYKILGDNLVFVDYEMTDTLGLVRVPVSFGVDSDFFGSIRVDPDPLKASNDRYPHYGHEREYIHGYIGDTIIIKISIVFADPPKLQGVTFAFKSDRLIDFYKDDQDHLPKIIEILTKNPKWKVELEGHTDNKEDSATHHKNLSQNRADNVKAYLIVKGINKDRITTKALGSSEPSVPFLKDGQDDPEGRARNRRVEFKIIPVD